MIGGRVIAVCAVAAALVGATCGGCSGSRPEPVGAVRTPPPSVVPLRPTATVTDDGVQRPGPRRWRTRHGVLLPATDLTPGRTVPGVTSRAVCAADWGRAIHAPRYSSKLAAFTGYGVSIHDRATYRVDHLVPVSLGGSNDVTNLWPQPATGAGGAGVKDALETRLHQLVCSGSLPLPTAQRAIASDWSAALARYGSTPTSGSPTSRTSAGATPTALTPTGTGTG
jgi:hypothetical protein